LWVADYTDTTDGTDTYRAIRVVRGVRVSGASCIITYTYGCVASLKQGERDAANRLVNVDGVDYTWDANGNLLNDGVRTFTYDAANRLTPVTSGTLTTTFEYDGLPAPVA
jgi:hypothetical protein